LTRKKTCLNSWKCSKCQKKPEWLYFLHRCEQNEPFSLVLRLSQLLSRGPSQHSCSSM
jgi:hypothetical protein